jgi:hypothetical protein
LHTIFRRIGFIHHSYMSGQHSLSDTIDHHLALLNGIVLSQTERAIAASDGLVAFVESMFDEMEKNIDPSLLDCSIEPLLPHLPR